MITKEYFRNNDTVCGNLSELYSCLKICHGFNIDGDVLVNFAWKYFKKEFIETKMTMQQISDLSKHIHENFDLYFKIKLR